MTKSQFTILVIDDDDDDQFFHQQALKATTISNKIIQKYNGYEAIDLLKNLPNYEQDIQKIDLILLDLNMPLINGWEFIEQYEKLPLAQRQALIVVMSSPLEPEIIGRALTQPCVIDALEKPLKVQDLQKLIRRHFPSREIS